MRFTLKYRGSLPGQSSGTGGRVREKQAIRRYLHPQLKDLWERDTNRLAEIDPKTLETPIRKGHTFDVPRLIHGFREFFFRYPLGGFNFVPIVTSPQEAHCELAVRLHRPTPPGSILYEGGDLDNRLKVLFDALRIPTTREEIDDEPAKEAGRQIAGECGRVGAANYQESREWEIAGEAIRTFPSWTSPVRIRSAAPNSRGLRRGAATPS